MELELTSPALLFPALSLLMLAYTNKFLAITSITRQLTGQAVKNQDQYTIQQIQNLRVRINILKFTQLTGLLSILGCLFSMLFIYLNFDFWSVFFFISSISLMMISICLALIETSISGNALKIELKKIEYQSQKNDL